MSYKALRLNFVKFWKLDHDAVVWIANQMEPKHLS